MDRKQDRRIDRKKKKLDCFECAKKLHNIKKKTLQNILFLTQNYT